MANKIYIAPTTGKYLGKLLVFDTVESMSHVRTSRIPQHPVESLNRSVADHRFREGAKITLTGMVSDNWNSSAVNNPTPPFKIDVSKRQAVLREKMEEEFPRHSYVNLVVNQILDKKDPNQFQLQIALNIDTFWISEARKLLAEEKDALERAQNKQINATQNGQANDSFNNLFLNTIQQAKEMLNYLDQNSTICTVVSMHETYNNMVLTNFTNVLRGGPQRGAYWVNLSFDEQLIATTVTKESVIDYKNTEVADKSSDKGKTTPPPITDKEALWRKIETIWDEQIAKSRDPKIKSKAEVVTTGQTAKNKVLRETFNRHVKLGDTTAAEEDARQFIRISIVDIGVKDGKI